MPDLISLMSQEMMRTFADQKERLEEGGRLAGPDLEEAIHRLILGRLIKACVRYRDLNMAALSRRLNCPAETVRAVINGSDAAPEVLKKVCQDEILDLKGWLAEIKEGQAYFSALIDEAIEAAG